MRIEKWGFLLSYALYLVFCIVFSFISEDTSAIKSMISAITIASTTFSISDLLFSKFDIDKKERESLFGLYYLTSKAEKVYMDKINSKYGTKADEMYSLLMELFEDNVEEVEKFFGRDFSLEEKGEFIDKVKSYSNDELTEFVINFLESDISDIKDMLFDDSSEEDEIFELLNNQKKKEQVKYIIASIIAVLGLAALLIILTLRVNAISYVNNGLTVVAFLAVIINLLLKEYYKSNSLKNMDMKKKELINDLRTHNDR